MTHATTTTTDATSTIEIELDDFDRKVLREISLEHHNNGGSRFPSPVSLVYSGQPTRAAKRLGFEDSRSIYSEGEERVLRSIKRLHAAERVYYCTRYGDYCWVIPAAARDASGMLRRGEIRKLGAVPRRHEPYGWNNIEV